ncbi:hypothetical protein ACEOHC_003910 [Salmonella enterica]
MKKVFWGFCLLAMAVVGGTLHQMRDREDTTHTVPLRAVLEEKVLANPVSDAYPTLAEEGFAPVKGRPGYWKRDTDRVTLIIHTRIEHNDEVVDQITVQP